jgi:hypothetical protein
MIASTKHPFNMPQGSFTAAALQRSQVADFKRSSAFVYRQGGAVRGTGFGTNPRD